MRDTGHTPSETGQKNAIFRFFETYFGHFGLLVSISFLYSILSALLLPSGLAEAGIANVTRNLSRGKHSFGISDFFDTIKSNWKQSLLIGIIHVLLTMAFLFAFLFYYNSEGIFADIALAVLIICFVAFSFTKYYTWFLVITFDLPTGNILKNSFLFVFVNLKTNLLIGVIILAIYAVLISLVLLVPHFMVLFLVAVFAMLILPGFVNLLIQWNIFPAIQKYMIDPYYEAHPGEDLSLRRDLNMDTGIAEEKEPPIFRDT